MGVYDNENEARQWENPEKKKIKNYGNINRYKCIIQLIKWIKWWRDMEIVWVIVNIRDRMQGIFYAE